MVNIEQKVYDTIFIIAMRDATLRNAYEGKKKDLGNPNNFPITLNCLITLYKKLLDDEYTSQEDYDKDLLKFIELMCNEVNSFTQNNKFTFGNAQKFFNIAAKEFYKSIILCGKYNSMRNNFRFCHCPQDQQLIQLIWKQRKLLPNYINLGSRKEFNKSWGKENFENYIYPKRYLIFQEAVNYFCEQLINNHGDIINSIEFDFDNWNKF